MRKFIPGTTPGNVTMLDPRILERGMEDDVIEIPDSAGLSDAMRDAIANVWSTFPGFDDDCSFDNEMHYMRVPPLQPQETNK
jgi:hypothetical protein